MGSKKKRVKLIKKALKVGSFASGSRYYFFAKHTIKNNLNEDVLYYDRMHIFDQEINFREDSFFGGIKALYKNDYYSKITPYTFNEIITPTKKGEEDE